MTLKLTVILLFSSFASCLSFAEETPILNAGGGGDYVGNADNPLEENYVAPDAITDKNIYWEILLAPPVSKYDLVGFDGWGHCTNPQNPASKYQQADIFFQSSKVEIVSREIDSRVQFAYFAFEKDKYRTHPVKSVDNISRERDLTLINRSTEEFAIVREVDGNVLVAIYSHVPDLSAELPPWMTNNLPIKYCLFPDSTLAQSFNEEVDAG